VISDGFGDLGKFSSPLPSKAETESLCIRIAEPDLG